MKEAEVLAQCLGYLRLCGIFCWRQNTGSFKTKGGHYFKSGLAGTPDIIGVMPDGRFLGIEVKREYGGRTSEAQEFFQERLAENNALCAVVSSAAQLEEIIEKYNAGAKLKV